MRRTFSVTAGCILLFFLAWNSAEATLRYKAIELSGDLSAQTLVRHKRPDHYQLVQERNTVRLRLDYTWFEKGRLLDRIDLPFIEKSSLLLLYRGVYDAVFDIAPGGNLSDNTGEVVPETAVNDIPASIRKDLKFENELREAYVDLSFRTIPLRLRLGRQQIVWGEADFFRLLDRVNALDLTWHLVWETELQHGWDQLRIPYWMIRYTYDLPKVGPISQTYLEGFWNPGDWRPGKFRFLPYSTWSLPFTDPLVFFPNGLEDSTIFRQGDYSRNPAENSQVGVRVGGFVSGLQFSVAYFYQRWAGDDGSAGAILRADLDVASATAALAAGKAPAEFVAPYTHTIGVSANYSDDELTGAVFKNEMLYELGVPFTDGDQPSPILPVLFGTAKRDMWKGLIGFDRPTWIRPLNRRSTFLILGQFFWHYIVDNERFIPGQQTGFVGPLGPPLSPLGPDGAPVDKVRDWEALLSLAATTFYKGGTIVPILIYVVDPLNSFTMLVFWGVDYYLTNSLIVNLGQRYFVNTTSDTVHDPWLLGASRGRSETQIRLTWQF